MALWPHRRSSRRATRSRSRRSTSEFPTSDPICRCQIGGATTASLWPGLALPDSAHVAVLVALARALLLSFLHEADMGHKTATAETRHGRLTYFVDDEFVGRSLHLY